MQHYLFGVWVRPEARRQGVAKALVETAIAAAREAGAGALSLVASEVGSGPYAQYGFESAQAMRLFLDPMP